MRNDARANAPDLYEEYGQIRLSHALLHEMRHEFNLLINVLIYAPPGRPIYTWERWPRLRMRAGTRAFVAVRDHASWSLNQQGPMRFKTAGVTLDATLHPLDFQIEVA